MNFIGIDGCRAGWFAVTKDRDELMYRIYPRAQDLVAAFPNAERILIDIPIGLPWKAAPIRPCDRLAREVLGPRRSSVFPVPCRDAAYAKSLEAARAANLKELDRSLPSQSWGICKKIAEIDDLLQRQTRLRKIVREVHPEVCFWGLAGGSPMQHNKKTREGLAERLAVLGQFEPSARQLLEQVLQYEMRKTVLADDVLDALVAYVISSAPLPSLQVMQAAPTLDQTGLSIEMVYLHS
jgi:predicted RNase H-like nuclease